MVGAGALGVRSLLHKDGKDGEEKQNWVAVKECKFNYGSKGTGTILWALHTRKHIYIYICILGPAPTQQQMDIFHIIVIYIYMCVCMRH